jgi:hypothetical protein
MYKAKNSTSNKNFPTIMGRISLQTFQERRIDAIYPSSSLSHLRNFSIGHSDLMDRFDALATVMSAFIKATALAYIARRHLGDFSNCLNCLLLAIHLLPFPLSIH